MSTFPFLQLREFGDDGKLLGGGRIWFFEQGATTPKTTWQDVAQTIPNTNPVMLSASGSAKIECNGAYSYRIERYASGGYILQDEGSFTAGDGNGSGSVTVYENYEALEVATSGDAVAIVQDGYNPGDRAGGVFLRDDAIPQTLTDGVSVIGVHKYRRVYNGPIAATWCGVIDTGLAQSVAVTRALTASITYGHPVAFDENIQLESAIQVQAGAAVILGDQCRLSGSIVVNWNFVQGSQLVSCAPAVFGPNVRPRFDTGVFEFLRLSWCKGATDDETLTQFLMMPNVDSYTLVVDKSLDDVRTDFTPPGKTSIRFEGGRIRFTTGSRSIAINAWETPPDRQVFEFTFIPVIGSIVLPEPALPEWFGAVGNGTDEDATPMTAAIRSARVFVKNAYFYTPQNTSPVDCEFIGTHIPAVTGLQNPTRGVIKFGLTGDVIFSGTVNAQNVAFTKQLSGTPLLGNKFNARDCSFSIASGQIATFNQARILNCHLNSLGVVAGVAGVQHREACYIADTGVTFTDVPISDIRNARLGATLSASLLYTDAEGDIMPIGPATIHTIDVSAATIKADTAEAATSKATRQVNPPIYVTTGATLTGANSLVKLTGFAANATITLPTHTGREGQFIRILADHQSTTLQVFGTFVNGLSSITVGRLNSSTTAAALVIATTAGWDLLEGA